jgi:hypothetical protein
MTESSISPKKNMDLLEAVPVFGNGFASEIPAEIFCSPAFSSDLSPQPDKVIAASETASAASAKTGGKRMEWNSSAQQITRNTCFTAFPSFFSFYALFFGVSKQ